MNNTTVVVAYYNEKGGVSKTSTCVNLAYTLAQKGRKILVIDFDPQNNASSMVNVDTTSYGYADDPDNGQKNIGSIIFPFVMSGDQSTFSEKEIMSTIVSPTYTKKVMKRDENGKAMVAKWEDSDEPFGFDILPAIGFDLSLVDLSFSVPNSYISSHLEYSKALLKNVVDIIRNTHIYDYIFIDCCPSLGLLSINALVASDFLLIPTNLDYLAAEGIQKILDRLDDISQYIPNFQVLGVLLSMYSDKRVVDNIIESMISDGLVDAPLFNTKIPETVDAKKAVLEGRLLVQKNRQARQAFISLGDEMEARINESEGE